MAGFVGAGALESWPARGSVGRHVTLCPAGATRSRTRTLRNLSLVSYQTKKLSSTLPPGETGLPIEEIQDDVVVGPLASSLEQRGKDGVHPASFLDSAVEVVEVRVAHDVGGPLDPGAKLELVHIGVVSIILQVSGMFLAVM